MVRHIGYSSQLTISAVNSFNNTTVQANHDKKAPRSYADLVSDVDTFEKTSSSNKQEIEKKTKKELLILGGLLATALLAGLLTKKKPKDKNTNIDINVKSNLFEPKDRKLLEELISIQKSIEKEGITSTNKENIIKALDSDKFDNCHKMNFMYKLSFHLKTNKDEKAAAEVTEYMLKKSKPMEDLEFHDKGAFVSIKNTKYRLISSLLDAVSDNKHFDIRRAGYKNQLEAFSDTKNIFKKTQKIKNVNELDVSSYKRILSSEIQHRVDLMKKNDDLSQVDHILKVAKESLGENCFTSYIQDETLKTQLDITKIILENKNIITKKPKYAEAINKINEFTKKEFKTDYKKSSGAGANSYKTSTDKVNEYKKLIELKEETELTEEVLKKQRREMWKKYHPDIAAGAGKTEDEIKEMTKKMQEINNAIDYLSQYLKLHK